jgi:hypothetical protein
LPALSEDLTGLEDLSGLVVRIRIYRIREFSEWGGFYSVNSEILEILIRTISYLSPSRVDKQSLIRQLPTLRGLFQI